MSSPEPVITASLVPETPAAPAQSHSCLLWGIIGLLAALLLVVLVCGGGLLLWLWIPGVQNVRTQADISAARTQIGMFKACLERYALDCGTYPSTSQGLRALLKRPKDLNESAAWGGPYLDAEDVPKDPWGHEFGYAYPPTHGMGDTPDIWSKGPDGEEDTADDVASWLLLGSG